MRYRHLVQLVIHAAEGIDNLREGAIGFNGYGFVFRDINDITLKFDISFSSQVSSVGTTRRFLHKFNGNLDSNIFYKYHDISSDLIYIGAIKTLIPSLKFDVDDLLFEVWMLVKTPENRIFPATLYYGRSRLGIGGWDSNFEQLGDMSEKLVNFNPFNLKEKERHSLSIALEFALHKAPVSDFGVKFRDDYGDYFLGVDGGVPIFRRLNEDENWPIEIISNKAWNYLNKFEKLIEKQLTPRDNDRIKKGLNLEEFRSLRKNLIKQCYNALFQLVYDLNSRIAFEVLGSLFMEYNVKFTDEVKKLILQNSQWKDERHKLKDKKDKIKRKRNLLEFKERILNY